MKTEVYVNSGRAAVFMMHGLIERVGMILELALFTVVQMLR